MTSVTYCSGLTAYAAADMAESIALCCLTHGTVHRLGTGCLNPVVTCSLTVGLVASVTYRGGITACAAAGMTKCLPLLCVAELTDLRLGTGCFIPNVLTFTVATAGANAADNATGSRADDNADKHEKGKHKY